MDMAVTGSIETRLRQTLVFLGATQLALGAFQAIAPGAFFDAIADFGSRNDHYLRDVSTLYLALGISLLLAATRPTWRVPVLAFATIQYALHALNHLIDIGEADPGWVGPFDFVSLALFAVLLAYVMRNAEGSPR
jgi:Domain of unknown function (DUF4345)